MDLSEITMSRRTIHNFKSEKVPEALVQRALELSLWAPNHKLTFPWVYFVVEGDARAKLGDLYAELKSAKKALGEVEKKAVREKVTVAGMRANLPIPA